MADAGEGGAKLVAEAVVQLVVHLAVFQQQLGAAVEGLEEDAAAVEVDDVVLAGSLDFEYLFQ